MESTSTTTIDLTDGDTDSKISEPEYFTFLYNERRQAENDRDKASQELHACLNEREQMIKFLLEVKDEENYLRKWREVVEFKFRRAEAALKIIDNKTSEVFFGLDSSSSEESSEEGLDQTKN